MRKFFGLLLLITAVCNATFAEDFDFKIPVKATKGIVKVLGEDLVVIELADNANKRYVARNLPNEFKKNELRVTFSGLESSIPPYIRMAGTPLYLLCIKADKSDVKKFALLKSKYTFKKP